MSCGVCAKNYGNWLRIDKVIAIIRRVSFLCIYIFLLDVEDPVVV